MMKKVFLSLAIIALSALPAWAVGVDTTSCIGQDGITLCLPVVECGNVGFTLCSGICGGVNEHWTTHETVTTTTTTPNSMTVTVHDSSSSHSLSTGPMIWSCIRMIVVDGCHGPVWPWCPMPCGTCD